MIAARNRQRCGREQAFISTAFANLEMPLASAEALRETAVQRERFLEYGRLFAPKTPEKEKNKEKQGKKRGKQGKKRGKQAEKILQNGMKYIIMKQNGHSVRSYLRIRTRLRADDRQKQQEETR